MSLPYLILTHDYRRNSAGIRALHKLCHALNRLGQRAWVTSRVVNEEWQTPVADPRTIEHIAQYGVVVYPEVEDGNPLGAERIARFVLNVPGRIRPARFTEGEQTFAYCELLAKFLERVDGLLTVPVVDHRVFHPWCLLPVRIWTTYWVGKGSDVPRVPGTKRAIEITLDWPKSWANLAHLFRTSKWFYSYQPYSALIVESRLCWCPTVAVPNGLWTREEFVAGTPGGMNGLAWGTAPEELERAEATVQYYTLDYARVHDDFRQQLGDFIEITQEGWG